MEAFVQQPEQAFTMEWHIDGGGPDGTPGTAGHSTTPQRSDTGDKEAASLPGNKKMNTRRAKDWGSRDPLRLLPSWEMREDIQTLLLERSHSQSKQWMELCQFARVAWVINIWTVAYQERPCGWMVILSASLGEAYWRLPSTNCSGPTVKHGRRMIMAGPK